MGGTLPTGYAKLKYLGVLLSHIKHLTFRDEPLELLETALHKWEESELESVNPDYDLVEGIQEVRFRAIDVPIRYRADQPWETETETVETMVYAMGEELNRDVVPRQVGYGWPDVLEVSANYNPEGEDTLEDLHDDVATVVSVAHEFGWTIHDYNGDRIILKPANGPSDVNKL